RPFIKIPLIGDMLEIKCFVFSPIEENTYIIYNENKECIIIDPGCYYEEDKEMLRSFIEDHHLKPQLLLNTHCHLDHVFGNKFVSETYELTLGINEKEKEVLDFAPASGLMFNVPFDNYTGSLNFIKEGDKIVLGEDEF